MNDRCSIRSAGCAVLLCFGLVPLLAGQYAGGRRGGGDANTAGYALPAVASATSGVSRNIAGHVLNALTGAPVPRALVNLNSRAVLTDAQGKFTFAAFTDANGYAQASKPGYSASPTAENIRQQKIADLDAPVELRLYPNAILTGTITGPDGLPLQRVQVHLRRLTFGATGVRWLQAASTQTDVHGEYRIDVPGGRFRVTTGYAERSLERGEAVLPVAFPAGSASATGSFTLSSGEQRQIDLRPGVSPAHAFTLAVEGSDNDRGIRLMATGASGLTFPVLARRTGDQFTALLPAGTFLLRAYTGDRSVMLEGQARVIVGDRERTAVTINLAPQPAFSVEADFESSPVASATSTITTPSVQQFNLTLHNLANGGEGFDSDVRLNVKPDHGAEFVVPPGRYRLGGSLNGGWYVRSATNGVTDLLTDDLVAASGSAGTPIRLVISNAVGAVKGTVTTAGTPSNGWVYLVPLQPSLTPYYEIYVQSDGSYSWSGAPGKYVAVPSAEQIQEDFRDPAFLRRFEAAGRAVEITPGGEASADLTLQPAGVSR